MPTLQADLDLQLEDALRSLGELDDALQTSAGNFSTALNDAFAEAVASASDLQGTVTIEPDTSAVEPAVAEAVAASDSTVAVDADTSSAAAAVADLVSQTDADTATIAVDADTSDAQAAIDDLSGSAENAQSSLGGLTSASDEFTGSQGAAAVAAGDLAGGIGGLTSKATGGILAAAGLTVGIHSILEEGLQATSVQQRFNQIVGEFSDQVENVHVGNLNTQLGDLALKLGSTDDELVNASTNLFQYARNSGASGEASARFTSQITALAARAVALNPALGNVGDVADSMGVRLARGGRFAASFGVSLTAAEINARALADTGKTTAADLTIYEKSAAAAAIATERYGGTLKQTVEEGSKNAIIQQRSLVASFKETLETLGKPLVSPFLNALQAAIPLAEQLGRILAILASSILPPLTTVLGVVAEPLKLIADLLELIPAPVLSVVAGFFAFQKVLGTTSSVLTKFGAEGVGGALKDNLGTAAAAVLVLATAVDVLGQRTAPTGAQMLQLVGSGAALGFQLGGVEGAAIGAAAGLGVGLVKGLFSAGESADDTRKRLAQLGSELDKLGTKQAAKKFLDNFVSNALDGKVKSLNDELEKLAESSHAAAQKVVDGLKDIATQAGKPIPTKELEGYEKAVDKGSKTHLEYSKNQQKATATNKQFEASTNDSSAALQKQQAAEDAARQALEQLGQTAQDSIGGVSGAFDKASQDAQSFVSAAVSGFPDASAAFDNARSAAEKFGVSLTPDLLLQGLQDSLSGQVTFLDNLKVILGAGFDNAAQLIASKGPEVGGQLAQSLADGIRSGDPTIAQNIDQTAGLLALGGQAAAAAFGNAFTPQALLNQFEQTLTATANFTANLRVLMDSGLTSLAQLLIEKGPEVGGSLAQQLADGIRNGDPAVAQALNDKAALLETAAVTYSNVVKNEWGPRIQTAQNEAFANLAPDVQRQLGLVADQFTNEGPEIAAQAAAAASFGYTGFHGEISKVPGDVADQMGAAGDALTNAHGALNDQGNAAGAQVQSGWGAGLSGIPGSAGAAVDAAGNPISSSAAGLASQGGAAYQGGFAVGQAFSAGLVNGMDSLLGDIIAEAATLVQQAEETARREARAKSPSQLFADLGRDIGEGVVVGMAEREAAAAAGGKGLVQAAAGGASSVVVAVPAVVGAGPVAAAPASPSGTLPLPPAAAVGAGIHVDTINVLQPQEHPESAAGELVDALGVAAWEGGF